MSGPCGAADELVLLPDEWRAIRDAAAELDLIYGGYFRLRPAAIGFYCSPDNHPDGWDVPYTDGSEELPRELVGEAEVATWVEGEPVRLRLAVRNWSGVRAIQKDYDRGRYQGRFPEYVRDQERALRGREEDRDWLRSQFDRLQRHAVGALLG